MSWMALNLDPARAWDSIAFLAQAVGASVLDAYARMMPMLMVFHVQCSDTWGNVEKQDMHK